MLEGERRRAQPQKARRSFGELAQDALKFRMRDARVASARWTVQTNMTCVTWTREDGRHAYACVRRKLAMINGELGVSSDPAELDDLPVVDSLKDALPDGCRIPLGMLLHGHAKSWSSGGSEKALIERLDWIAQQLSLQLHAFMSATRRAA